MKRPKSDQPFRWLVGQGAEDPVWDYSTVAKTRNRQLDGEIRRRTDVVGIRPNDEAIIRLVGAILLE